MKKAQELLDHYKKISILESIQAQLEWDMETMMPPDSVDLRARQMHTMAAVIHDLETNKPYVEAVSALTLPEKATSLEERQLRKLKKELQKKICLDAAFVSKQAELRVKCSQIWKRAKEASDFSLVKESFGELIKVQREWASRVKGAVKDYADKSLYEVHLDAYEPGMPSDFLRSILEKVGTGIRAIIPHAFEKQARQEKDFKSNSHALPKMPFPEQERFSRELAKTLGYNFSRGRLDTAVHPFCGGYTGDTRITTRFNASNFLDCFLSVIHESGHAIYEQGIPTELAHTPCGHAASFGIHESQSRLFENQIGRSRPFCTYLAGLTKLDENLIYRHLNRVEKSLIRTEADELTYNLHILLRVEIEEGLINGKIEIEDLPELWHSKIKDYFGLEVPTTSQGVLQDVHWYSGAFGYFPTYSIGNVLSAQLFSDFKKNHKNWQEDTAKGNFSELRNYLRKKIHSQAALSNSPESIRTALGEDLNEKAFLDYMKEKYV